jgi:general secretion pathway protein C
MAWSPSCRLATELALVALIVCLAAFGVSAALRAALDALPPPASDAPVPAPAAAGLDPLDAYEVIAARDIFNPPGHPRAGKVAAGRLRLWGVGLFGSEARAVIEDVTAHRQELYRAGDEIDGARVTAIDWDRVTLARNGVEETLELAPPPVESRGDDAPASKTLVAATPTPSIRRTGTDAFVVDRRELGGAVDNMSGLLTQLRAVAEVEDGRPIGFRLFQIRDDSIFKRLGLENGDVVRRVNGTAIGDPAALLGFLQRLRSEPRVALDVVRGGTPRTLVYDLR